VTGLHFVITLDGRIAEERLWRADRPASLTIRDWATCTTMDEPTPAPKPESIPCAHATSVAAVVITRMGGIGDVCLPSAAIPKWGK
jgi:hypothetical protein